MARIETVIAIDNFQFWLNSNGNSYYGDNYRMIIIDNEWIYNGDKKDRICCQHIVEFLLTSTNLGTIVLTLYENGVEVWNYVKS